MASDIDFGFGNSGTLTSFTQLKWRCTFLKILIY